MSGLARILCASPSNQNFDPYNAAVLGSWRNTKKPSWDRGMAWVLLSLRRKR